MSADRDLASCALEQVDLLDEHFRERCVMLASGAQVAVRESGASGAGPTLVLLHGISSGSASWLQTVRALGAGCHVVAWNAPGYGHSTPLPEQAPTAARYAQRLHELLLALGLRRCVLAGHSLGALMACAYAARTDRIAVDRLVLISPARGYAASPADAGRVQRERRQALQTLGVAGLAERIDQRLLSPAATEAQRQWVRWNAARLQPHGYLQAVEMLCNSELAKVAVPVEVHCGDADVVTPPAACEQAARALRASCAVIAGAGHASPVEQPEAVAALLRAALEKSHG